MSYGYTTGYSKGNTAGYSSGFKVGNEQGYSQGYTKGNSTGYTNGYLIGYSKGYQKGWTATGFNIRDPTYQEMLEFIRADKTDENAYVDGDYICHDFSYDVKRNAFDAGYRCFWVSIEMGEYSPTVAGHAIVAFNTTDRGIIYIEPQSDKVMNVQIGQHYWDRSIYRAPSYDDTVTKIELIP
jgi:hypothetical protein